MATHTTNYNLKKPDASDPFGDFRGDYNDNLDIIDANLGGGGGSGGHTILDPDGNSLPQEDDLQFTGAVSVTDDNVNGRTVVNISGGSNLILDAQIYTTEEKQVGVWTDKKPLYRKTIFNVAPNTVLMSNVDTFVNAEIKYEGLSPDDDYKGFGDGFTTNSAFTFTETGGVITYVPWSSGTDYIKKTADYITIYYTKTTDTAGSGGYEAYGFSPVIYSDVERVIGVWRDNKPLYQKTYHFNSLVTLNSNAWFDTGFKISDSVIVGNSVAFRDDNVAGQSFPVIASADIGTNQAIELLQTRNSSITISGFTIQYTKTSDVAGSGDYNTYGVPTVHYDTNEQVIGTYLGKPLYQKTFNIASASLSSREYSISTGLSNIKRIIGYSGHLTSGSESYALPYERLTESESIRLMARANSDGTVTANLITGVGGSSSYGTVTDICLTLQYTKTTD